MKLTSPVASISRLVVARVLSLTMFNPRAIPTAAAPPEADPSALVTVLPLWVADTSKSPVRVSLLPLPMSALVSVLATVMADCSADADSVAAAGFAAGGGVGMSAGDAVGREGQVVGADDQRVICYLGQCRYVGDVQGHRCADAETAAC